MQWEYCPNAYASLAFLAAFLGGLLQIVAGFLQLGFLVSFLAHPVVSGFTSGAAITIGLSQVQYFFGYKIEKSPFIYETLINIFKDIHKTDYITLLLGLTWWFLLWGARKLSVKYKKQFGWLRPTAPLISCVLGIVIAGNWDHFGGCGFELCGNWTQADAKKMVVGEIPSGFPSMTTFDFSMIGRVFPTAVSCSVIGYMESIAIAKSLAAKHQYEIRPGQELFAIGSANLIGSIFSGYPVTGSFSRSAVNNTIGAQTNLAGLVTALLMMLVLVALTSLFYFLPLYVLAAVVISSVTNLVDVAEARYLWRVKRTDFFLWILSFLGTLLLGVQNAIILGVGISLFVVIFESVRPQMVILWRLPGTPIWRNIKQDSIGQFVDGVLVVRIGASVYFANVAFIRDKLRELVFTFYDRPNAATAADEDGGVDAAPVPGVRYVVIECTAVISLDSTAIHMLESLHREFKDRGIRVAFATVGNRMNRDMARAGLIDKIGSRWFHPSVHSAVKYCVTHQAHGLPEVDEEELPEEVAEAVSVDVSTPTRALQGDGDTDGAAFGRESTHGTELETTDPLASPTYDNVGVAVRRVRRSKPRSPKRGEGGHSARQEEEDEDEYDEDVTHRI